MSLPGLGWRYFKSFRTEEDEPIHSYKDNYKKWFVRQSFFGGRVCAYKQKYKSKSCDDISKIITDQLNVKGNIDDILEAYLNYKLKHFKIFGKENENQFTDYRDEDEEEKANYINKKLCKLPFHQLKKQLKLDELLWDFDATSLYPSAMWDENGIHPRKETGSAFTPDMNEKLVKKFNIGNFTQGSALLKIEYYNPKNLVVQHIPVKERETKIEINRMRNGYMNQTLTSVNMQEMFKLEVK